MIRSRTLGELLDVTALLANQPLPDGNRVAIVTNSGGPGIMCADACEEEELELAKLSLSTRTRLAELLPREASMGNPVDMLATASGDDYRRAIETLAADPGVDAVIAIFTPALVTPPEDVAAAIRGALELTERKLPLLGVFISAAGAPPSNFDWPTTVPMFDFPEEATRALAHAVHYSAWRERGDGTCPSSQTCAPSARRPRSPRPSLASAAGSSRRSSRRCSSAYGIPLVESAVRRRRRGRRRRRPSPRRECGVEGGRSHAGPQVGGSRRARRAGGPRGGDQRGRRDGG